MFVHFWMAKSPIVATEEMNLEEALYLMQRHKIRRMPVVRDENDLCGIIAISDIYPFVGPHAMTKALLSEEVTEQLRNVSVASIMNKSPITCSRNATIDEIGVIMRGEKIGAVPVLEGTKVVGIITESDILGALSNIAQIGSDSKRIFFRIPVMEKVNYHRPCRWHLRIRQDFGQYPSPRLIRIETTILIYCSPTMLAHLRCGASAPTPHH